MVNETIRGGAVVLRRGVLLSAVISLSLTMSCQLIAEDRQRDEQAAAIRAAEVARAQEVTRIEQEKQRLLTTPSLFLETSDMGYYDKGIINDYRQIIAVTVVNKSKFPVRNIQGDVEWVNESGQRVGSMPLSLKGSIPAGDTKRFTESAGTLTNGTIQTSAKRARVTFTHIDIIEAP